MAAVMQASPPQQVDAELLRVLTRAFEHLAGDDAVIDASELKRALGLRSEYLARRVMAVFDADGDGVVRRDEFLEGVRKLVLGSPREKLAAAFRIHDHDGDGALDRKDLERMILLALAEDDVGSEEVHSERLVDAVLASADTNGDGRVSFDEFEAAVGRHPHLLAQMTRHEARWLVPDEDLLERVATARGGDRGASPWREHGWAPFVVVGVWIAAQVALLALGLAAKQKPGHAMDFVAKLGRATTTPIELDTGILLLPVLRRILTRVRRSALGRALPVDEAIGFHRLVGHALFGLCVAHGGSMLWGYAQSAQPFLAQLAAERAWTGVSLLSVFTVMWVCAWQVIRRTARFELFYFTHLLYLVWFPLAIAHAPGILGAACVGLAGLVFELVARRARRARATAVTSMAALRSGVTRVELRRPEGFAHRAGDYLFLRIPSIARHEWHPFTITSAPESAALTVHVRSLGNWTSALRRRAEAPRGGSDAGAPIAAFVDGPYGSPSGEVFESRFAVLVGAGIGVTPFAAILESIVLRANGRHERPPKLEKASFFWLNRDRHSFEWFAALLTELERIDGAGVLDASIWMTGGRAGVTAAALELAREAAHAAGHRDVVTGLRTKTHMGHPDWDAVLAEIAARHAPHGVDVYFCGPPGLGRVVRRASARAGMRFREEKF
jgi:predicted ferric reductase/Ca2+-binding EF-hand superfamily protein